LALFIILIKSFNVFYLRFSVNIINCFSLANISFNVFRTIFLRYSTIIGKNSVDQDLFLRKAYFGGVVDLYKPYSTCLYGYDIKSLYPSQMLNDMPVNLGN
jgi:hypothetical protein